MFLEYPTVEVFHKLGIEIRHNHFDERYSQEQGGLDFENDKIEGEVKNPNGNYTISDETFEREYLNRFSGNKFALLIVSFLILTNGQLERLKAKCKKGLHIIELGFQISSLTIGKAFYWLTKKLYHIKKLLFNASTNDNETMSQKSISCNQLVSVDSKIVNSYEFIEVNNKNLGRRSILKNDGLNLVCKDEKEKLDEWLTQIED